jgi:valyl-tRNA synthetase
VELSLADRWILTCCKDMADRITKYLEPPQLNFSLAAKELHGFTWNRFCSQYLEIRKKDITGPDGPAKIAAVTVFATVLRNVITLLHPFMPFITEEIHANLHLPGLLITTLQKKIKPVIISEKDFNIVFDTMQTLLTLVDAVRQIRGNYNLPPQKALKVLVVFDEPGTPETLRPHSSIVEEMETLESLTFGSELPKPSFSASAVSPCGKV